MRMIWCFIIIIIEIIIIISVFQEDNVFGTNTSLTYGPQLQRSYVWLKKSYNYLQYVQRKWGLRTSSMLTSGKTEVSFVTTTTDSRLKDYWYIQTIYRLTDYWQLYTTSINIFFVCLTRAMNNVEALESEIDNLTQGPPTYSHIPITSSHSNKSDKCL